MTKLSVLLIFAEANFLTPDQVRSKLQPCPDRRSFYSYLAPLETGIVGKGTESAPRSPKLPNHEPGPRADCVPESAKAVRLFEPATPMHREGGNKDPCRVWAHSLVPVLEVCLPGHQRSKSAGWDLFGRHIAELGQNSRAGMRVVRVRHELRPLGPHSHRPRRNTAATKARLSRCTTSWPILD